MPEAEAAALADLLAPAAAHRREAALFLAAHPSPAACAALLAALGDPDPQAHEAVIHALAAQTAPERIERLVDILRGDQPGRRNAALSSLIEIGATRPADLTDALRHPAVEVRLHVAEVLGDLRHPAGAAALTERLADLREQANVRHAAAQALGKIGHQAALPVLVEAAEQAEFWVRYSAIEALGRLGDPRAVPPLLGLLRQDAWMRPATAQALGSIGAVEAVPDLAAALEDAAEAVRAAAVEALLRIVVEPESGAGLPAEAQAEIRRQVPVTPLRRELAAARAPTNAYAAYLLGWLAAPEALPDLVEALGQADTTLRHAAVEAVLRYGAEAIPVLLAALERPQPLLRENAVELLGMQAQAAVVPALVARLNDDSLAVRQAGVRALGTLGGPAAYGGLLQALTRRDTRDTALGVIGQLRDPALVTYLQDYLHADLSPARAAAAQALALLGDESAVSILLNATRETDPGVRLPAAEALGRVRSNRAVAVLIEALSDRDWLVRQKAVEALGNIPDGRAVTALLPLSDEPEWRVRRALVYALAQVGDSRVFEPLRDLARDPNRWVRRTVMEQAAQVDDGRAAELLTAGLSDPEDSVRQAALQALGRRREAGAARSVAQTLEDSQPYVRLAAVQALALLDPALASTQLPVLAQTDPEAVVREAAADALGELGLPSVVGALQPLLGDPAANVRERAAQALALLGMPEALEALVAALKLPAARPHCLTQLAAQGAPAVGALLAATRSADPEQRAVAAEALGALGQTLARPTLRLLTRDPDARVRHAADAALTAMGGHS
ncbi:MAG: HEAT repeat domain-containing protein [Anaerolineales bacterium]|nr:HEAT repeat domain-containing protein [Anaerolineales bacterium]